MKRSIIWLSILLAFFVLASSHFVHAYYIIIKEDGKKVEGEIVEETDEYIRIKVTINKYYGAYITKYYKKADIITEYEIRKQEEEKRKQEEAIKQEFERQQREKRKQEEAIKQEYERQQREKGLIEYKSKWVTKEELEKIKEEERQEEERQERRLEQIKREKEEKEKKEHEEYIKELRKQKLIKIGKIIGLIILAILSLCLIIVVIKFLPKVSKNDRDKCNIGLLREKADHIQNIFLISLVLSSASILSVYFFYKLIGLRRYPQTESLFSGVILVSCITFLITFVALSVSCRRWIKCSVLIREKQAEIREEQATEGIMADIKEIQKSKVGISLKKGKANRYSSLVILGVLLVVVFGFVRIYYGGGIGLKVVFKNSFSFKDTIVNLDDIIGLPRIVVATKHPAVKRQLEEMGFIQTDEQVKEEFEYESKKEYDRIMREAEEESKRLMKELKKEYGI